MKPTHTLVARLEHGIVKVGRQIYSATQARNLAEVERLNEEKRELLVSYFKYHSLPTKPINGGSHSLNRCVDKTADNNHVIPHNYREWISGNGEPSK